MFKISEFSRLSRIPLQTLRYYDQLGILKPAKTDESTGYRYYSAEQLLEMNRIVIFKELGFTLQQIAHLLQEDISAEQIRGMLRLKESEIERQLDIERSKLARVKERMQLVEREGRMDKEQEVVMKRVEDIHLITYASAGTTDVIPNLFEIFDGLLDSRSRASLSGPQTVLWDAPGSTVDAFELEVGYAVKSDVPKLPEHLHLRFLPSETVATLLFRSDSSFSETACLDLASWIDRNGYRIRSDRPGREIYVPLSGEPGTCLIEIQIPIEVGEDRQ
ncbi:DNA-binding transcriptional regulator, MerR family [Paenibacillus tianmuensis]|uniref:DNA-binding transcriptional regulator, MerR family n=1 Tax=Paenibacillus tianmuensis TaxID=624147 RepID=A0A1G4PLS9_9BACL|nr:MerR family transcriptional regulator [Paenibacillus tianmuensis]SCW33141.1 DNA-binding transcriptional regulator, MerR family [Paenibacillus tianmuensis]